MERDLLPGLWAVGHVFLNRVVRFQLSHFLEFEDQGSRELLGHRTQAEFRLDRVGDIPLAVRKPITAFEDRFITLGDQHGPIELPDAYVREHVRIQLGCQVLSLNGSNGCEEESKQARVHMESPSRVPCAGPLSRAERVILGSFQWAPGAPSPEHVDVGLAGRFWR